MTMEYSDRVLQKFQTNERCKNTAEPGNPPPQRRHSQKDAVEKMIFICPVKDIYEIGILGLETMSSVGTEGHSRGSTDSCEHSPSCFHIFPDEICSFFSLQGWP